MSATLSTTYDDWLPQPPEPSDPKFQTKIAVQYMDYAAQATEAAPRRPGDLFSYQLFDKEFFRSYDRGLLFYEAGTGKTCSYVSVAEDFRQAAATSRVSVLVDALVAYQHAYQGVVRHVFVLLKGETLVDEFRNQLACRCTPETYLTPQVQASRSRKAQKQNLSREINKWYTVQTYIKFFNTLQKKNLDQEALAKEFEGCMFIMDEIHALQAHELTLTQEDRGELREEDLDTLDGGGDEEEDGGDAAGPAATPGTAGPALRTPGSAARSSKVDKAGQRKYRLFTLVYDVLWNVVHAPRWCKVILATATPMINRSEDLINPMNLLLPADAQLAPNTALDRWSLAQFRSIFSGYVSFVRAGDTGVDTVYMGEPLDADDPMLVVRTEMMPFQAGVYLAVVAKQKRGVRNEERQASNFVFPDGSYGGKLVRQQPANVPPAGIGLYVNSPEPDHYQRSERWLRELRTLNAIRQCSNLYATIVDSVRKSPGLCFVYQELFTGSGAIVLAMCFETLGFKRFRPTASAFEQTAGLSGLKPLCAESDRRQLSHGILPALRYGLITNESNEDRDRFLLELFNSPENAKGEYIKVLIGSRVVRDGINLANVVDVYLPAMWTPSGMYQAMQRAIRATSHVAMVKDSPTGRVDVRIHRMASVAPAPQRYSVDLDMYKIIATKDREIAKVRRLLKQVAVDCWLNHNRNARPGGEDYSPECDYDVCQYTCADPQPTLEDVTAASVPAFANQRTVALLVKEVFPQVFSYVSDLSLDTLVRWLGSSDPPYGTQAEIYAALLHCQNHRVLFRDRHGQLSEVASVHDRVVLVPPGTPPGLEFTGAFYRSGLVAVQPVELRQWYRGVTTDEAANEAGLIEPEAKQLEAAVLAGRPIPPTSVNFYYEFKEPVEALAEQTRMYAEGTSRRGRRPTGYVFLPEPLGREAETGTDTIKVHSLYTIPPKIFPNNAVSLYESLAPTMTAPLRVLHPGDTEWKDATRAETVVYTALIRGRIREQLKLYEDTGLYGSVYADNVFRIRDMSKDAGKGTDRRTVSRGVKCDAGSFKVPQLIEYIERLGGRVPPPESKYSEYCSALYNAFAAAGRLFILRPTA